MASVLAKKPTAKEAWASIAKAHVGDIDDFAFRLSGLMQKLEMFGDDDINEERTIEKLLHASPTSTVRFVRADRARRASDLGSAPTTPH